MSDDRPLFRYKPRGLLEHDERTIGLIFNFAATDHTQKEAAALLGVSLRTFCNYLEKHEDARNAWKDGRQIGKASLRRQLHKTALEDPPTLRYLAKVRKIYKDDPEQAEANKQADEVARRVVSKSEMVGRVLELLQKTELAKSGKSGHGRSLPAPRKE